MRFNKLKELFAGKPKTSGEFGEELAYRLLSATQTNEHFNVLPDGTTLENVKGLVVATAEQNGGFSVYVTPLYSGGYQVVDTPSKRFYISDSSNPSFLHVSPLKVEIDRGRKDDEISVTLFGEKETRFCSIQSFKQVCAMLEEYVANKRYPLWCVFGNNTFRRS